MGLEWQYHNGQTPLDEDEKADLLVPGITARGELDEHEQLNIEKAVAWSINLNVTADRILTENFIKNLHKKMLGNVWGWAGHFRTTEKNIGLDKHLIGIELRKLLDDTLFWIDNETFPPDEIAIRFKHRLVNIHCFPNGNGRHSRLMADILISSVFSQKAFSWHSSDMVKADETRKAYINAIHEADNGNINPLIDFARN
jgi:Fic-DOC domain mobile mystery protein B